MFKKSFHEWHNICYIIQVFHNSDLKQVLHLKDEQTVVYPRRLLVSGRLKAVKQIITKVTDTGSLVFTHACRLS